jgi:catechol-2,3-dioxygenase
MEHQQTVSEARTLPPMRIGEVVLKTARFEAMNRWWQTVLGISPYLESEQFAFRRLPTEYPYTQILIIVNQPELEGRESSGPGLDHVQFRHASLGALLERYEILRDLGIKPHRTMNHGPSTSFYYSDPDGNRVELSAVNFPTEAEYVSFVASEAFKKNIAGVAINADEFVSKYRSGVQQSELVRLT